MPDETGIHGPPPNPAVSARRLVSTDFDEIAQGLQEWDARFRQLGGGQFAGELNLARVGQVQALELRLNRSILGRGSRPPGGVAFSPVLAASEGASWRGRRLSAGQMNVLLPADEMDHRTPDGDYRNLTVVADESALREAASDLLGVDLADLLDDGSPIRPAGDPYRDAVAGLARLARGQILRPDDPAAVEAHLLRLLARALASGRPTARADRSARSRREVVAAARGLMEARSRSALTVRELCREVGVSERTLFYAFQDHYRISPMAFHKSVRLNGVRDALKAADPGTPVKRLAESWGFWHAGQFAADYQKLFGELPSESLRA